MLRIVVRGVVAALMCALAVAVPQVAGSPAAHATSGPDYFASQAQAQQQIATLDGVEASYQQAMEQGAPVDWATMDYLASMVPPEVYTDFPVLNDLIHGADPYALGVVTVSGANIPPCPAAGLQLLAGFPAPYGHFTPNPANNWCTPNGPDNGCSAVPSSGFTFDFRAACRQHDLGYRWVPAGKASVDFQFLKDMSADCAKRSFATAPFCYTRAGVYYAGVSLLGFVAYGNSVRPGYNRPLPILPLETAPTCAQPTHAWVASPIGSLSVPRGTIVNLTGVIRKHNRIKFEFYDSSWNLAAVHLTYFSDNNCVVRHERETFNTNRLPLGTVYVMATYAAWEQNDTVRTQVATMNISAGGGTTTCNQFSHAWVAGGPAVTRGAIVYLTGVVHKYSRITFDFYDANGTWITQHVTQPARDNCVVYHEPEWFSTSRLPVGTITVKATFLEWETDQWLNRQVGTLYVQAPPPPPTGGGGGGGGGGCTLSAARSTQMCPLQPAL